MLILYYKIISLVHGFFKFNMAGFMFANVIIPNEKLRIVWNSGHYSFENPLSIVAAQATYTYGDEWLRQYVIDKILFP